MVSLWYPVAPGTTGRPAEYMTPAESELQLAGSHGYVAAGIDHTYESLATAFPDGRVTTCLARQARRRISGFWEKLAAGRAADVSFVLNELTGADPPWPGAGLIGRARMGMAGSTYAPIPDGGLSRPFLFLGKQAS